MFLEDLFEHVFFLFARSYLVLSCLHIEPIGTHEVVQALDESFNDLSISLNSAAANKGPNKNIHFLLRCTKAK
jgi:hypothetical protein